MARYDSSFDAAAYESGIRPAIIEAVPRLVWDEGYWFQRGSFIRKDRALNKIGADTVIPTADTYSEQVEVKAAGNGTLGVRSIPRRWRCSTAT